MVLDTSAIVAMLAGEPESPRIQSAIAEAADRVMSAVTAYETRVVLGGGFAPGMLGEFEGMILRTPIGIVPFDDDQALRAAEAYRRFGKGTGHPARLNLGDCAAYALARSLGMPLLFKGGDFARTDIEPALV